MDPDAFDILIGVSIGTIMFLILLCGLCYCFGKSSDSSNTGNTRTTSENNRTSVNSRVHFEEDSKTNPSYQNGSDNRFARTENL